MRDLLTVVVPFYNRSGFLPTTLESLRTLSGHRIALTLVDNGSTDGSLEICRKFAECNRECFHISVLQQLKPGASAARNLGLNTCKTPYIYFFDSDDIMTPNFATDAEKWLLEDYLRPCSGQAKTDLFFLPVCMIKGKKSVVRAYTKRCRPEVQVLNGMFNTLSMLLRTDFLRQLGAWNEDISTWDDWELGIRVAEQAQHVRWCTEDIYHQIILHDKSQTGRNFSDTLERTLQTMKVVVERTRENANTQEALFYRALIMAAKLHNEGNKLGAKKYRILSQQISSTSRMRKIGSLLYLWTRLHLPAAWHIALWIISKV